MDVDLLGLLLQIVVYPRLLVKGMVLVSNIFDLVAVIAVLGSLWMLAYSVLADLSLKWRAALLWKGWITVSVVQFFIARWDLAGSDAVLELVSSTLTAGALLALALGLLWRIRKVGDALIIAIPSLATILTILVVLLAVATLVVARFI